MKNSKPLHEAQKEHRESVKLSPCIVCSKEIKEGFYGRHQDGGTCSGACERIQQARPKYPNHSEEDYLVCLSEAERH